MESLGEETLPGVVAHENHPFTCRGGDESELMIRTTLILLFFLNRANESPGHLSPSVVNKAITF